MTAFKIAVTLLISILALNAAVAQEVVRAVVVKSWNAYPQMLVWEELNEDWSLYGTTPIIIDYTTLLEAEDLSLADLEDSAANVIIVSDPAGGCTQWQQSEIDALEMYTNQGHTIVGTFVMYQNPACEVDNRALARLWGHRSDLEYIYEIEVDPMTTLLDPSNCLFTSISGPMNFGGNMLNMTPGDGSWDDDDLAGAYYAGRSDNGHNVVTIYDAGSYSAFYISNMPEYNSESGSDAQQWLYNAIVCEPGLVSTVQVTWSEAKAIYREY
jgi:hypothetical protein